MINLKLFQNRVFAMGNVTLLLNFMAQFSVVLLMPFYLTVARDLNPAATGLLMSASPVVLMFAAPISGALSDRIGFQIISSAGMGINAVVLFLLSQLLNTDTPLLTIAILLSLFGLGNGMFQSPNSSAIMGSVPRNFLGVASGTLASMRSIGMVTGIAVSGAVFSNRLLFYTKELPAADLPGRLLESTAYVLALKDTFLLAAVLAGIGIITSLVRNAANKQNQFCGQQNHSYFSK